MRQHLRSAPLACIAAAALGLLAAAGCESAQPKPASTAPAAETTTDRMATSDADRAKAAARDNQQGKQPAQRPAAPARPGTSAVDQPRVTPR